MNYAEIRKLSRQALLSEIDLYQFLRGRRPAASKFARWPLVRGVVKDKRAAAKRLRARLSEMISAHRGLRGLA